MDTRIRRWLLALVATLLCVWPGGPSSVEAGQRFPNILLVVVDTLRADRLSSYGYDRPTSPQIDRLLAQGVRFEQARTVEPLTGPAVCSMLTSRYPHEHGASRNGVRMRDGLASLPKRLARRGYETTAFVGNWTLRDRLTGLGDHFENYEEIFSRKRWLGLFNREATAHDLTNRTLEWLGDHRSNNPNVPFLAWVHYVEPHAPYRLQKGYAPRLGVPLDNPDRRQRYDTEVAFVDAEIGRLLRGIEGLGLGRDTLVVFVADHGESLGEHGYWGHGRNLYEPTLHIPLGWVWPGRLPAGKTIAEPAMILDVAPTLLGLLGLPPEEDFRGFDWSDVMQGKAAPPTGRVSLVQAHKGAFHGNEERQGRVSGLLEVGKIENGVKEVWRLGSRNRWLFDLRRDPKELRNQAPAGSQPSPELLSWLEWVESGLEAIGDATAVELDEEAIERLRALGYIDD